MALEIAKQNFVYLIEPLAVVNNSPSNDCILKDKHSIVSSDFLDF